MTATDATVAAILDSLALPDDPGAQSWQPLDLTDALAGRGAGPPSIGAVSGSEHGLLYPGRVHWFSGEPASGKGWVVLGIAAQLIGAGHDVVYVDCEDSATGIVNRLRDLLVPDDQIREHLRYIRPEAASTTGVDQLVQLIATTGAPLAVVDGVTEAMALHGRDPRDNADTALWMAELPRRVASAGAAVACLDHVTKDSEARGRWAIGAQHKLAGLDGVAWTVEQTKPFGRGRSGAIVMHAQKDRAGYWARGDRVDIDVSADPDGGVHLDYRRPASGDWEPVALMDKVQAHLTNYPGASLSQLRRLGKSQYVDVAIHLLIERGAVRVETVGQAHHHYLAGGEDT